MSDLTAQSGAFYASLKRFYDDLERLAEEFKRALAEKGRLYPNRGDYSYGSNLLMVKPGHVWSFSKKHEAADDEAATSTTVNPTLPRIDFAALYVRFEAEDGQRSLYTAGRPELWAFIGWEEDLEEKYLAKWTRGFLDKKDQKHYVGGLKMAAEPVAYDCGTWKAVAAGREIGEIETPESLRRLIVEPLLNAAEKLDL